MKSQQFEYGTARIRDLQVRTDRNIAGRNRHTEVLLNDEPVLATNRFWNSLHLRFGFTSNIFRYFTHREVFQRISDTCPNDLIRWCVERDNSGQGQLLAVTSPGSALITHDDLMDLLGRYGAREVQYSKGVLSSRHEPRGGGVFQLAGDGFENRFLLDTPIDGFGRPQVYLSLLRLMCSNGAVGYSPTFRSEVSVGRGNEGVAFALTRVLDGFNNEEGFAALRQRFESAAHSWASVNEVTRLYRTLARQFNGGQIAGAPVNATGGDGASLTLSGPLFHSFHKMSGDLSQIYGLSNLDVLSVKRQRTLPAGCKVYDLINFASEVATHHATPSGNRTLQAYIGDLISGEYDLEGTATQFSDWRDFFISNDSTTSTLTELHQRGL
jgi:hypothetical protein